MIRNIVTISATALAAGALAFAPLAAGAVPVVNVSAIVPSAISITATTDATTTTWTGLAVQAVPFSVTVLSNDPAGYQFTFTGTNAGAFSLDGTNGNATVVPYSVTGTGPDGTNYVSGVEGGFSYPGPTGPDGSTETFDVGLPVQANIQADTYSDVLNVIATVTAT